ncbi:MULTISPECIES: hypothetical protein [Cyanophyceae]|uniref:hypothetical protein n=1 Tax=Cyanophyceae TaxID=3028117 RepID=UPI0016876572|nr:MULTISPECIES: hypothetical protein [Cyanophyceae]MBD1914283.1 hypothetical protein [Phormidium sp. FACHB-77]MBD2031218.1 hypothetical protein [Phormidium sp. FACHB-322]MBD2049617.1 hypothetical protein [Leptolyngbya sp. FACHB-60]
MPRKPGQSIKGRSIWVKGTTLAHLLAKEYGATNKQTLLQRSQDLTDSELADLVDSVLIQHCFQTGAPAAAPVQVPQPTKAEEAQPTTLNLEFDPNELDDL